MTPVEVDFKTSELIEFLRAMSTSYRAQRRQHATAHAVGGLMEQPVMSRSAHQQLLKSASERVGQRIDAGERIACVVFSIPEIVALVLAHRVHRNAGCYGVCTLWRSFQPAWPPVSTYVGYDAEGRIMSLHPSLPLFVKQLLMSSRTKLAGFQVCSVVDGDVVQVVKQAFDITSMAFHPTLPMFACGSSHETVSIYSTAAFSLTTTLSSPLLYGPTNSPYEPIWSVAFHPTLLLFAAGAANACVYLYSTYDWCLIKALECERGHSVKSVAFHASLPLLASGADSGKVHVFNTNDGSVVCILDAVAQVACVAFHPSLPLLACAAGGIRFYNTEDWVLVKTLDQSVQPLTLGFHASLPWVVSQGEDGMLCIRNVETWTDIKIITGLLCRGYCHAISATFHSKLPLLAVGTSDNKVHVCSTL